MADTSLPELRSRIDALDLQLITLLNERAEVSKEVGRLKSQVPGTRWYQPEREREIYARLDEIRKKTSCALPKDALEAVYREILSSSRALQKPLVVSYWGPAGTYTHLAAVNEFGSSTDFVADDTIADVFSSVERGQTDFGVVPIENSTEGAVHSTLDMLQRTTARICAEIQIPIIHNLLSKAADLKSIERLYTFYQPLSQCRKWVHVNLPNVEHVEVGPTTRSVERALADEKGAAIAGSMASELYDLPILVENIGDDPRNTTRFVVIGRDDPPASGHDKTSLIFAVNNKSGALARALQVFDDYNINLSMITSRPSQQFVWNYLQYVDMQGHASEEKVKKALKALREKTHILIILGSYPEA